MSPVIRLVLPLIAVVALSARPTAAFQGPPPPAPELKKLEFLVGKYTGKGKVHLPGQPTADWTTNDTTSWILDGHYLRTEAKSVYSGLGLTELSSTVLGYDPTAKVYRMWRFSNGMPTPHEGSGTFEGKKLIILMKPADQGEVFRATYEPREGKGSNFLLEQKMGDKWVKFLEGAFTPAQ